MNNTLLSSEARKATAHSDDQVAGAQARGVMLILDVTAAPEAADTLTVAIEAKDPATGKYVPVTGFAATGKGEELDEGATLAYTLYPGGVETTAVDDHEVMALPLPTKWRATVTHSAEGEWTYSLGAVMLR